MTDLAERRIEGHPPNSSQLTEVETQSQLEKGLAPVELLIVGSGKVRDCSTESVETLRRKRADSRRPHGRSAVGQTVAADEIRRALGLWDNTAIPSFYQK